MAHKVKKLLCAQRLRKYLDIFSSTIVFSCENDFLTKSFLLKPPLLKNKLFLTEVKKLCCISFT